MVIVAAIAVVVALISLGVSLVLWQRLEAYQRQLGEVRHAPPEAPALPVPKPLEGLRIVLAVSQDHPRPVFSGLLKERLLREDVASVEEFGGSPSDALEAWRSGLLSGDLLIAGGLTCNGYADVYYQAEFACQTTLETVVTIVEKPSGGDRPENLALEIVSRLGSKLDELVRRNERRRAIAELHGD